MDGMRSVAGSAVVVAAAVYLLALGGGALLRPEATKRFLGGFATTPRIHFTELALRGLTGAALVSSAPRMAFGPAIALFGWVLAVTSLALALVPWRLHRRFAVWSVPRATRHMPLIGITALAGGAVLLAALFLPRTAG